MACEIASDAYDDGRMSEIKHETTPVPPGEKGMRASATCFPPHIGSQPKEKLE